MVNICFPVSQYSSVVRCTFLLCSMPFGFGKSHHARRATSGHNVTLIRSEDGIRKTVRCRKLRKAPAPPPAVCHSAAVLSAPTVETPLFIQKLPLRALILFGKFLVQLFRKLPLKSIAIHKTAPPSGHASVSSNENQPFRLRATRRHLDRQ